MLKFYITPEERQQAQKRAAELDVSRSHPPGKFPYVWDNRLGCVNRWYDFASPEDKIGTISFDPVTLEDSQLFGTVECTTEITYHPMTPRRSGRHVHIADVEEHKKLVEYFYRELLHSGPECREAK